MNLTAIKILRHKKTAVLCALFLGLSFFVFGVQQAQAVDTVIFLTGLASTTWTVPSDWNTASNTIEVIGGGGGGSTGSTSGSGGGGGSAYARIVQGSSSLVAGQIVGIKIGTGGASGTTGVAGGDTFFCNATSNCGGIASTSVLVGAKGGGGGGQPTAGIGGATSTTGSVKFKGGNGGLGSTTGDTGGGGGGAAGPAGNGATGGIGQALNPGAGGGGGGAASGTVGAAGNTNGGNGGDNELGSGHGLGATDSPRAFSTPGTNGGGGGGGLATSTSGTTTYRPGANGGMRNWWTSTLTNATSGPGGGGGGAGSYGSSDSVNANAGSGGTYGGGGGGGELSGGTGAQGIIIIKYGSITVLGDGTNPSNVTIGPEAAATSSDAFTFRTSTSTDVVTAVIVGLTPNSTSGLSKVEITSNDSATVYGSSTNPTANSSTITLNQNTLTATITTTTYKIRITPKSHVNMPAPPGSTYAVTSTIISFTSTNASSGTDGTSATITIDNLSPSGVTNASGTAGDAHVDFSWTNPGGDYHSAIVVRATSTAVTGSPTEGTTYSVGNTVGNGVVACVVASSTANCTDSGVANDSTYYYEISTRDNYANYDVGVGPTGSPFTPTGAKPQISAAANQTFTALDSAQSMSAITVTSTAATNQITALNDIRITLATSTGAPAIFWDTSQTTATISGSGNVSTAVSYENGSSTLVVNVLSDFANASSVTISGLSYNVSGTVNVATTTRDLRWLGAGQASAPVRDAKTVTVKGKLEVNQHSAGQETNQFAATSTAVNKELFAFQLLPTGESATATLIIQLTSATGIVTSDITGALIYKDTDADGTIEAGETTTVFGPGSVNIAGGTGTITFGTTSTVALATSTRYILKATTTNLLAGDTITFGLAAGNVSATGTTTGIALSPVSTNAPTNVAHTVPAVSRTQRSFRWQNDDGTGVNNDTSMAAADTAVSGVKIGQRLTLRVQLDNDGGGEQSGTSYKLQFQANSTSSGGWVDVAAGTAVDPASGLAGADNADITGAVAAANSRTFRSGKWRSGTTVTDTSVSFPNAYYSEFGFMLDTANAAVSTTYYFRLFNNSSSAPLEGYSDIYPSLVTVADSANLAQYSKQAGQLQSGTSSLTYWFDQADYNGVATSSDGAVATSTATNNKPIFNFRIRNSTSGYPIKINWTGRYTSASTTSVDIYDVSAGSWLNLTSTSTPSVNTTFTLFGNATASPARFYEADGANFWSYLRAWQGTTTGSLSGDLVDIDYEPMIDSASDQTFTVSDATTTAPQLTITTTRTPVIVTSTGIRIAIPASLNMNWDTSVTSGLSYGGTASGNVSSTVSYPTSKTLLIPVVTNFAAGDTLTVSGLKFANFSAASASTTLQALYGGSTSTVDAIDSHIKQIKGLYVLGGDPGGQQGNKFDISGNSLTGAQLLNFQVAPSGEDATTTQLVINILNNQGFVASDITSAQLFVDANGNGVVDATDTTAVGGAGFVSLSGTTGSITFSTPFTVTSTPMNLILTANVGNINAGYGLEFQVQSSGISASGQTSKLALPPSGNGQQATHNNPGKGGKGGGPTGGGPPPTGGSVSGGTPGGAPPSEGGPPPGGGNQGGGGAGSGGGGAP